MAKKIASQLFAFQCKHGILDEKDRRLYEYRMKMVGNICKKMFNRI